MKTIEELQKVNRELEKRCQWLGVLAVLEARNHDTIVKELTGSHNKSEEAMAMMINQGEQNKSINEFKAQAIEEAINYVGARALNLTEQVYCNKSSLLHYANMLRGE